MSDLKYGFAFTASDLAPILRRNEKMQGGVRTWSNLFGNTSLGHSAQTSALQGTYGSAIADAYATSMAQKNAILGAGLSIGATREMLDANRNALHQAYQTYVQNYASNAQTLGENLNTSITGIQSGLTERATNFANLYNSAYDYLASELYGSKGRLAGNASNGATPIYENDTLTGYEDIDVDYIKELGLDWTIDPETGLMRSWDSISRDITTNGELNEKGVQFFDQIFNARPGDVNAVSTDIDKGDSWNTRGFDEWLAEKNPDLRAWMNSTDYFNYTKAGTNLGTAKQMIGMNSDDYTHSKTEHAKPQYTEVLIPSDIIPSGVARDIVETYGFDDIDRFLTGVDDALNKNIMSRVTPVLNNVTGNEKHTRQIVELYHRGEIDYGEYTSAVHSLNAAKSSRAKTYEQEMTDVKNLYHTGLSQLKSSIGTKAYEEFLSNYESVLKDVNTALTTVAAEDLTNENVEASIKKAYDGYKKFAKAIKEFLDEYNRRDLSSGL